MANRRVLIADDDPGIRRLLRRMLGSEFTISEAEDGDEAVRVAAADRPSVVLLDLDMPVLDGHGALLRLQADPELRTTPVLIVTGAATGGQDAAMFLRDGAHDFVRKPFEEVELVARVRAAHRHKALEEALKSRNRELEAFASFAAHDLKSPLTTISGIVGLLTEVRVTLEPDERERFLHDIGELASQGSRLVADLLALAKEDWAGSALGDETSDLRHLLDSVVSEARLAEAEVRLQGEWAEVAMPETALRSVFGNLLSNASHYGRDEAGRLELTITGHAANKALEVTFADRGPGIDPALSRRVFEPFFTAPGSQRQNPASTGLGLAVVGRTLERHGGRVELLADQPLGTAFLLTLPTSAG